MRILLVDDDVDVRDFTVLALEGAGYSVSQAGRADEALASLTQGGAIDLLITDVVMPGGDGIALAKQVLVVQPSAKVLFTTGYTRHIALDQLAGSEVLDKPYQVDALLHAVRHMLGG
jgi:CheY-like chemotaxis protein